MSRGSCARAPTEGHTREAVVEDDALQHTPGANIEAPWLAWAEPDIDITGPMLSDSIIPKEAAVVRALYARRLEFSCHGPDEQSGRSEKEPWAEDGLLPEWSSLWDTWPDASPADPATDAQRTEGGPDLLLVEALPMADETRRGAESTVAPQHGGAPSLAASRLRLSTQSSTSALQACEAAGSVSVLSSCTTRTAPLQDAREADDRDPPKRPSPLGARNRYRPGGEGPVDSSTHAAHSVDRSGRLVPSTVGRVTPSRPTETWEGWRPPPGGAMPHHAPRGCCPPHPTPSTADAPVIARRNSLPDLLPKRQRCIVIPDATDRYAAVPGRYCPSETPLPRSNSAPVPAGVISPFPRHTAWAVGSHSTSLRSPPPSAPVGHDHPHPHVAAATSRSGCRAGCCTSVTVPSKVHSRGFPGSHLLPTASAFVADTQRQYLGPHGPRPEQHHVVHGHGHGRYPAHMYIKQEPEEMMKHEASVQGRAHLWTHGAPRTDHCVTTASSRTRPPPNASAPPIVHQASTIKSEHGCWPGAAPPTAPWLDHKASAPSARPDPPSPAASVSSTSSSASVTTHDSKPAPRPHAAAINALFPNYQPPREISWQELSAYLMLPVRDASLKLDVSVTTLKRLTLKFGLDRWPFRKLRMIDQNVESIAALVADPVTLRNRLATVKPMPASKRQRQQDME